MQMEETGKESIVIVHGTWAAPKPEKTQWYQRPNDVVATEGFVRKLDAALRMRGSPARCWAHCSDDSPIFQWSGENSWIARTRAAAALAEYLAERRAQGWRCHIVAHSHGGNIVMEALPQILAVPGSGESHGTIVTLGSPFMDTMSPILKRIERTRRILDLATWAAFGIAAIGAAWFSYFELRQDRFATILFALIAITLAASFFGHIPWIRSRDPRASVRDHPPIFAMGSSMDEAWQVLHHIRTMENPLALKSSLFQYVFASLRSGMSRAAQRERIYGAKSYRDLALSAKLMMGLLHSITFAFIALMIAVVAAIAITGTGPDTLAHDIFLIVATILVFSVGASCVVLLLNSTEASLGRSFYSAFLSPFRWCIRALASLGLIFPETATYFIRGRGWSVLQAIAMGLEGYRFNMPAIEQYPRNLPERFVRYENMPANAEQRAMERRSAWVARHLGDVSQTFAKLAVTASDTESLLRTIESDQTLLHAAYYTDDDCIARIADWISGRA
jgi:hypothetical protein